MSGPYFVGFNVNAGPAPAPVGHDWRVVEHGASHAQEMRCARCRCVARAALSRGPEGLRARVAYLAAGEWVWALPACEEVSRG